MYNNSGGQSGPSKGIRLSFLTQSDQTKFEQIFTQSAGQFGGNKVSAQVVSELLRRSNLDNDSLAKIWDLASIANAPHLSFPEFAVAMFLTSKKLTGQTLPASLPPNIREETELAMATIASTETSQPSQQLVNTSMSPQQFGMMPTQQQNMMTGMPPQQTGMMTGMPSQQTGIMTGMPPQQQQSMMTGMMPPQQTGMMTGMPPQQTGMITGMMPPQQTGMPQQFRPSLPNNYQAPIQRAMQTGYMPQQQATKPRLQNLDFAKKMMPNQNGVTNLLNPSLGTSEANKLSWKISPEDKQRYREIFHAWEGSGSGFMSGDTAKDVLTQSQLPPQDLMKIWNLADVENKGSLDVDEFAIAMHLVYRKLNGFEVPTVLPAELKPPSSVLKKFVLGRRPPPSVPKFSPQVQQEEEEEEDVYDDYTSSSRRKGPQSASSNRYASRYNEPDEADVLILEDLRRQISETKRTLDRIPVPKSNNTRFSSDASKYSLEELKEKIRRAQDDLTNASLNNPHFQKYTQNSDTLLDLLETEKSLQEEINYLCNRDIPVLARQLRGAAAELRDTKVRYSRKNDGTQDFMAFVQPSGPGGSITEGDRVRAKAKAMMAARKAGNKGSSTDAAYGLRRAEEEKEEADKKADAIERDMERSRTALLDMRGDLRYLEEMIAAQDLEDKKRFENNSQDLSYELRRFIEQLNNKPVEPSYRSGGYQSPSTTSSYQSSGYQSPAAVASPAVSSPKPKAPAARPRTAEEIKKEAERRVQERLAALQAKRNPAGSPRSVKPSVSKPDEAEVAAQQRLREAEREAQENLRQSVNQREETDRKNRELELERIRENDRLDRQRIEDDAERQRQEAQEEEKRREQEEQDFLERRRQVLAKEEADRQARFDAIRRDEEEAELKKQQQQQHKPEHKPEEASEATPPPPPSAPPAPAAPVAPATPVESTPPPLTSTPLPISSTPTPPPAPAAPSVTPSTSSSNNPFAKLQGGSSQAEKPNEPAHKRVSYNPFAAFSAFSATKGGAKDESDSEEEDDGWGHDDSDDENEFPAAGSAKNLAGKLFSAMSKRENSGSLETVREVSSPKPNQNDTTIPPPPPPPPATNDSIPPPPPAPAAPVPPPAPMAPPAPSAPQQQQQASIGGGGDMRNALLSQIQSGKKLKKAVTNDRSASSIAGHVISGNEPPVQHTPAPVQPMAAPEIAAPAPISAPLSSGGFLAELQARTTTSSNEASPAHEPAVVAAESEPRTKHDESLPEQEYIALWDYPGSGSDDLIFSQDDVILVRDNNDAEDWWFGTHEKTQKTGYFPRNYVQPKPEAAPELNIKAKALYDFEGPDGQGCLNLTMGDMITILVKENDDWWKAQSQDGQIGLVPVNYVEEL